MSLVLRDESPDDIPAIYEVVQDAFRGRPYAGGDEQDLVNALRKAGRLSVALVAEESGEIIGHIAFSPARSADGSGPWYALGPVAVRPDRQSEGIGGLLINAGLDRIRTLSAIGCILTGNPAYYSRFGFKLSPETVPVREAAEYFQVSCFADHVPAGPFEFDPAFYNSDN